MTSIWLLFVLKLCNVQSVMTDETVLNEITLLRNDMAILQQQNENHHTFLIKLENQNKQLEEDIVNLKRESDEIKQELGDLKAQVRSPSNNKDENQSENKADIPIQTKGKDVTNNATDLSTLSQVILARSRKLSVHLNCFFNLIISGFK